MKALSFEGTISHESVAALLEQIDGAKDEPVVLYFSSNGGNIADAKILADYINLDPQRFTVVGVWDMSSATLWFFIWLKCFKRVFPEVFAEVHLTSYSAETRDLCNPDSFGSFMRNKISLRNYDQLRYLEAHGLTEAECDKIRGGEGVYLDATRICEVTGCVVKALGGAD